MDKRKYSTFLSTKNVTFRKLYCPAEAEQVRMPTDVLARCFWVYLVEAIFHVLGNLSKKNSHNSKQAHP